jgi:hypothetical protein
MHTNNILVPGQFGFRLGISTKNATFKLTDSVLIPITKKCMLEEVLLGKLRLYSIQGTVSNWFRSYLIDRKQKTEVKSFKAAQIFF